MTLIAIACQGDRAEIVTDSAWWTPNVRKIGTTSKLHHLHHLDAVLLTAGALKLGTDIRYVCELMAHQEGCTFDSLAEGASEWLRLAWDGAAEEDRHTTFAFLVGYSTSAGEFVAHAFSSRDGFTHRPVKGGNFITPAPWSMRPSALEIRHARAEWAGQGRSPAEIEEMAQEWATKPPFKPPASLEDWAALAVRVQEERSLPGSQGRVIIAGKVVHTELRRDSVHVQVVHDLNAGSEDSEEFRRLVADTDHPSLQLGPCACGSGTRWLDCCLVPFLDGTCTCGSGQTFRDCCMVQDHASSFVG